MRRGRGTRGKGERGKEKKKKERREERVHLPYRSIVDVLSSVPMEPTRSVRKQEEKG